MAMATGYTATAVRIELSSTSIFGDWIARFTQYRLYRKTVSELQGLSARELSDLGLSRSGIKAAALNAVYGL
ncbi:hypothetical protein NBRC116601_04220 [Cognatishimia sp. WU-CL00825]|uniref:DUF1127 domain-containing protein n=1 Tax=Cognatishimia sp. WU-CL00825 TaxID=3127658 RepID=UPI00310959FF